MVSNIMEEKGAKWRVVGVLNRFKLLPLSIAETEMLELTLTLPFGEADFQLNVPLSMQLPLQSERVFGRGKRSRAKDCPAETAMGPYSGHDVILGWAE
jgi:hypothetical protein